jgi:hypothetical protein
LFQAVSIQPSGLWTRAMQNSSMWPLKGAATLLTRAQAFLDPEVLRRDLDRARPPEPGRAARLQPVTDSLPGC